MEIKNFFPKFPNIYKSNIDLFNTYEDNFNNTIVSKKEFAELKLAKSETIKKGDQYNHQKIIARFLSSVTPYDQLLLFHDMGTGKTCTAIGAVEQLRYEKNNHIKGALVFARGNGLLKNFIQELLFTCTGEKYIPENYDKLSDLERIHRTRKITSKFYQFFTFERFAKDVKKLSDHNIQNRYDNHIIIIDEVHNLREKDKETGLDIYSEFKRFLHVIRRSKIVLLSGTTMKDGPAEFASVMNLILPKSLQFETDKTFLTKYFDQSIFKPDMKEEFVYKIRGRVSYLKSMTSEVTKIFAGQPMGNLKHFFVVPTKMSPFQTQSYNKAYALDKQERSIFSNARQAALFVFPDGTYGQEGFSKYIVLRTIGGGVRGKRKRTIYGINNELSNAINSSIENLSIFSSKYAYTIKNILDSGPTKYFVYCEFVNGSGAIVFAKMLDQFGFIQASGVEKTKHLRYALITNQTSTSRKNQILINKFNSEENIDGEYISVVIGSRVISEGITLKNIREEFIHTPHWNYSETAQVNARGWRMGSHQGQINRGDKDISVKIHQEIAIPDSTLFPSIDLEMYETSESKDITMKQIEHVVKKNAFDCPLTISRNKLSSFDGMRECDYQDCEYTCNGFIKKPVDTSTYNLYYVKIEKIHKVLTDFFRQNFYILMNDLFNKFKQFQSFELIQTLKHLIDENTQFTNKYGFLNYLRIQGETIYISADPEISNNNKLVDYYSKNLIIENDDSFLHILTEMYNDELPSKIQTLFNQPQFLRTMLTSFPEIVQRVILQGCIEAEEKNLEKNKTTRTDILKFFKGFYVKSSGTWVIWLYKETLGISCFENDKWNDCSNRENLYTKHIERLELKQSPIGYYGLHNPRLDDFCIRNVQNLNNGSDLRKLTVGRRCVDWDQSTLVDIAARRMKLSIPSTSELNNKTNEELISLINRNKYKVSDDLNDMELMKRVLYWSKHVRVIMCEHIKKWFEENDLIEENFDCGHQKKQRNKFK